MSLNETPSSERVHISFFGCTNSGKSSLINAVTGQNLSIVSDVSGTTTDPVKKAMELLPIGPIVVADTPGLDDESELGAQRIDKAYEVMRKCDVAVVVIDAASGMREVDRKLIETLAERNSPYIIAWNKADIAKKGNLGENEIAVSARENKNINELKQLIAAKAAERNKNNKRIVGEFISAGDVVVLVVPIDAAAPKGRLILPQQQTLRDILDSHASAVVVQTEELGAVLESLGGKVRLVVTDSQAFSEVRKIVPEDIMLTSFSILFARYKGNLRQSVEGADKLDSLEEGARVLISEGCTHHRQCGDIGTQKLPAWIEKYTGKKLCFAWTSGNEFKNKLEDYSLIIHCGGCMLNEAEMKYRLKHARDLGVAMTNYGIAISKMNGILKRSLEIFGENY